MARFAGLGRKALVALFIACAVLAAVAGAAQEASVSAPLSLEADAEDRCGDSTECRRLQMELRRAQDSLAEFKGNKVNMGEDMGLIMELGETGKNAATRRRRRNGTTRRRRRQSQSLVSDGATRRRRRSKAPAPSPTSPKWARGAKCGVPEKEIASIEAQMATCDTEIRRVAFDDVDRKTIWYAIIRAVIMFGETLSEYMGLTDELVPSDRCCSTFVAQTNKRHFEMHCKKNKMDDEECWTGRPTGMGAFEWDEKAVETCCGLSTDSKCDVNAKASTCMPLKKIPPEPKTGYELKCGTRSEEQPQNEKKLVGEGDLAQSGYMKIADVAKAAFNKAKSAASGMMKGGGLMKMAKPLIMKMIPKEFHAPVEVALPHLFKGDIQGAINALMDAAKGGRFKKLFLEPLWYKMMPPSDSRSGSPRPVPFIALECVMRSYVFPLVDSKYHIVVYPVNIHTNGNGLKGRVEDGPHCEGNSGSKGWGPLRLRVARSMLNTHPDYAATKASRPEDVVRKDTRRNIARYGGKVCGAAAECIEMCSFDYTVDIFRCMAKDNGSMTEELKYTPPATRPRCDAIGWRMPRSTTSKFSKESCKCKEDEPACSHCRNWYLGMQSVLQNVISFGLSNMANQWQKNCP